MPELPEVETIRRAIEPHIVGACITDISLSDPSIADPEGSESLQPALGATIRAVLRRGKHLILLLAGNSGVVLHLRMTGALFLCEPPTGTRVRAVLSFSNGERLVFTDLRRLGKLRFYQNLKPLLLRLGLEPLGEDFTAEALRSSLSRHSIPIKATLLDQHIIAGVGNMYADEALFLARINPTVPANSLDGEAIRALWQAIRDVLQRAVDNRGASISTYAQPDGHPGMAQFSFNVAHKKGAPCPTCGTQIDRVMVRKRGSYYCPECQRRS
jgi:formamidopyrimidine-DNA glycosylase